MKQNNIKSFVAPIIAIFIFTLLIFTAGYAYFTSTLSMNTANYQVNLPKQTSLVCSKTDCAMSISIANMTSSNSNATTPKGTSTCSVNCTCSGSQGAVCTYNVTLLETGPTYTPSSGLGTGKEYTVKVTSPAGCTVQNTSSTETQVSTMKNKIVSACSLTVPSTGSISANVAAEFKWYNLNLDQNAHAGNTYQYSLTTSDVYGTLTLNPNGGSVTPTTKSIFYNAPYGTLPTPTKSGSTFDGWYLNNVFSRTLAASTTSNYNYFRVAKVYPGTSYTLKIASATLTAGTATQFSVLVYDFTKPGSLMSKAVSFGSNITIDIPSYSWDNTHDVAILIYSGLSGSTMNNATSYSGIKLSTNGGNAITETSQCKIAYDHTLYANYN